MKSKKKKDTIMEEILSSTENVNQIGVEQALSLSKAAEYAENSVKPIWGTAPVKDKQREEKVLEKTEEGTENHSTSIEQSSIEQRSMEQSSMEETSRVEQTSIEQRSMEQSSMEETSRVEQTSIEQSSRVEQSSIEQSSIDDPSKLTFDWQITLYTLRKLPAFIREQKDLNANEKLILEYLFDKALAQSSHIVSVTNSDIQSKLNISYKWVGKTMQSLVEKEWIDHKLSLSKNTKSKASIERVISKFVVSRSLNIQANTLINHLFYSPSMEESSIATYRFVMLVSKYILLLTNKHTNESTIEESSIDEEAKKEVRLYFSIYSSLKTILIYAVLKGFDLYQISKGFLNYLEGLFDDAKYGDRATDRANKIEELATHALYYSSLKARKNKWVYLEKAIKEEWALQMSLEEHKKCDEELTLCSQLCQDPDRANTFGIAEVNKIKNTFTSITKIKEVKASSIAEVREDIRKFFHFTPKEIEEFLAKNGYKSRKPSEDLLG
ncbi:MAG: hypothetical protein GX457_17790 [Thermotogaceae bacterium]|nr:hypothetical protein [Thermotogaceae bacterium]